MATNHEAENRISRVLERGPIEFEAGTSTLTEEGRTIVDEIGAAIANISDIRVEILAHADADGDPAANRTLSLEQARAVRDVLSASIHPDRLLAVGYDGDRRPVAEDGDAADGTGLSTPRIEFRALHRP